MYMYNIYEEKHYMLYIHMYIRNILFKIFGEARTEDNLIKMLVLGTSFVCPLSRVYLER